MILIQWIEGLHLGKYSSGFSCKWTCDIISEWYLSLPLAVGILYTICYCSWEGAVPAKSRGNGRTLYGTYTAAMKEGFPPTILCSILGLGGLWGA